MNFFKSLSVRLKLLTLLWLVIAVASISYTLLLSWRLEGSAAAINDLETLADALYQQALDTTTTGALAVWDTDHDYWAADPTAAQQRIPAAMHRVAAARAAHHHTRTGTNTRIIPANTPHKTQER